MGFYESLLNKNYLLTVGLTAWFAAQVLKTIINFVLLGKFQLERMWGAGGMPSAHSALVCSFACAAGRCYGMDSNIFALAFVLAAIVMYDAMGVRRAAGEQAKVINKMIADWVDENKELFWDNVRLKEMLGHTPIEVLSGAILGVILGFVIPCV